MKIILNANKNDLKLFGSSWVSMRVVKAYFFPVTYNFRNYLDYILMGNNISSKL